MSFFPPQPEPDEPPFEIPPQPAWLAPPEDVLGRFADLQVVLARTDDVVLALDGFRAYPTGVAMHLQVQWRSEPDHWRMDPFEGPAGPGGGPSGALRLGVELADGRRGRSDVWPDHDDEPAGPVLVQGGGGGGGRRWDVELWLWPLPPPGPLVIAVDWEAVGLSERTVEVDAGPLVRAAAQATPLWPEGP
jgi:hypothetical protein